MSSANITGLIFSFLTILGASGFTASDVQGFVTVIGALATFVCFVWSHLHQKAQLAGRLQ